MGLYRQRRLQKAGLPEFVCVLLAGVTVAFLVLSWRSRNETAWLTVKGEVVRCQVDRGQYHVVDTPYNVRLSYKYDVGGTTFTGKWSGYWPVNHSPNALPPLRVSELEQPGYLLQIACNPDNASDSRVHGPPEGRGLVYDIVAILGCIGLYLYSAKIYPRWKTRQPRRFAGI